MAIEFELGVEVSKIIEVPLSAIKDHYLREGYKVTNIVMAPTPTGMYKRSPPNGWYEEHNNCRWEMGKDGRWEWMDYDKGNALRITLQVIGQAQTNLDEEENCVVR